MKTIKELFPTPIGDATYFSLTNDNGHQVVLSSLGAAVIAITVPDRNGNLADVVIGYPDATSYIGDGPCAGKTPGRYANRIANGIFSLEGKTYNLPINNGPNHLHGGPDGYQNRIWQAEEIASGKIRFSIESCDGDAGYPGKLKASVTYTWDNNDNLTIEYDATTDAPTIINLTNHSYFNMAGHNAGATKAMEQLLKLNCSNWLPNDETSVPMGEIATVENTPMDFRVARKVGESIFQAGKTPCTETLITDFFAIRIGKGYDNCWLADKFDGNVNEIATLTDPESGRKLTVSTDQPGVQVYGGNWVSGCPVGKEGAVYTDYCAVAIECQGCPDAPNKPNFPSQILNPGETYHRVIRFTFTAE